MIDLTLRRLLRPALDDFRPDFGSVVEKTIKNKGGLSTTEVDANMALGYEITRAKLISASESTSQVEYNVRLAIAPDSPGGDITIGDGRFDGVFVSITNNSEQSHKIVCNNAQKNINIVPGEIVELEWWGEWTSVKMTTTNSDYTYIVDSNEKLAAWAKNDTSNGQDYTSVLICKGEWTSSVEVNLTNAGTKIIVGAPGSKLVFIDTDYGLRYDTPPATQDCYMLGVSVESQGAGCTLLKNCINLTNCTGVSHGNYAYVFSDCTNLTNCAGTATIVNDGAVFYKCTSLTNCLGEGNGQFSPCPGFEDCANLTNCTGVSEGSEADGWGFYKCTSLTNCTGKGNGLYGASKGRGFYLCYGLSRCKAGGHCSTEVFNDCYASLSRTDTYACADTPAGGFNNIDNPA